MKLDTVFPLVDVMPLYEALAEITSTPGGVFTEHGREFLIAKLKVELPELIKSAKHVQSKIKQFEASRAANVKKRK